METKKNCIIVFITDCQKYFKFRAHYDPCSLEYIRRCPRHSETNKLQGTRQRSETQGRERLTRGRGGTDDFIHRVNNAVFVGVTCKEAPGMQTKINEIQVTAAINHQQLNNTSKSTGNNNNIVYGNTSTTRTTPNTSNNLRI